MDESVVQKQIIHYQIKNHFKKLRDQLVKYYEHPYEKNFFVFIYYFLALFKNKKQIYRINYQG